jgi:hypothetical protein
MSGDQNVVFLQSPATVDVVATPAPMSIYYADIGLGDGERI